MWSCSDSTAFNIQLLEAVPAIFGVAGQSHQRGSHTRHCPLQSGEKQGKVQKLSKNEVLMLNIGSMCTGARVIAVSFCSPSSLVCAVSAA